jgi:hypothetical protein
LGTAANGRDIGSGAWLGHGEAAEVLAPRDLAHLLLRVRQRNVGYGDDARARDDAGGAHPGPRQLFGDEAVLEDTETEATVLLRRQDPEETELAHAFADLLRDLALDRVELVGRGEDLLHRELASELLDRFALVGVVRGRDRRQQILHLAHDALRRRTRLVRS